MKAAGLKPNMTTLTTMVAICVEVGQRTLA